MSDEATATLVLQTIGDAKVLAALAFVVPEMRAPSAEVRAAAIQALGELFAQAEREHDLTFTLEAERTQALPKFIGLAHSEREDRVLAKMATASAAWSDDPAVGLAMLELFGRVEDATTQRNILFAASKTRWPQRTEIIQRGLASPGNGVAGVALEAVAARPQREMAPAVLALLKSQKEAQPNLIDAAGALGDVRALPTLLRWLKSERNLALQLKLANALQEIPGDESARALAELLEHSAEPVLVEQLCRIASERELAGAVPTLCALAEDSTAPVGIRGLAVWALGRYRASEAGACLKRIGQEIDRYFPAGAQTLRPESLERARLYVVLARWRHGEEAIEPEITRLFNGGTPAVKLTCLLAIAELGYEHPVIESALGSTDYAVLLGGVRAAGAAKSKKYLPKLRALGGSPLIGSLVASGFDTERLPAAVRLAIARASDLDIER